MNCPLCNKELKEFYSPKSYHCPQTTKMHDGFSPYHYSNLIDDNFFLEEIYLPPYSLTNKVHSLVSVVKEHITGKILLKCPLIRAQPEEKLLARIKTLIVLS